MELAVALAVTFPTNSVTAALIVYGEKISPVPSCALPAVEKLPMNIVCAVPAEVLVDEQLLVALKGVSDQSGAQSVPLLLVHEL